MAEVKRPAGWIGCALLLGLFLLCFLAVGLDVGLDNRSGPSQSLGTSSPIIDELNGTSFGKPSGIEYATAINDRGAVFQRRNESRIQYQDIPNEGTLEWWINVRSGYHFSDYTLYDNQPSAMIFTTDAQGGDVTWPGSTWFFVASEGTLSLVMATTKYDGPKQTLKAVGTGFRFNQWHAVGMSFGSQGQYIMLDGVLVASATRNTQKLGRGGNHSRPVDVPTVGEAVSGFWAKNRYDGGFEGIVDRFRISNRQQDWYLCAQPPK